MHVNDQLPHVAKKSIIAGLEKCIRILNSNLNSFSSTEFSFSCYYKVTHTVVMQGMLDFL